METYRNLRDTITSFKKWLPKILLLGFLAVAGYQFQLKLSITDYILLFYLLVSLFLSLDVKMALSASIFLLLVSIFIKYARPEMALQAKDLEIYGLVLFGFWLVMTIGNFVKNYLITVLKILKGRLDREIEKVAVSYQSFSSRASTIRVSPPRASVLERIKSLIKRSISMREKKASLFSQFSFLLNSLKIKLISLKDKFKNIASIFITLCGSWTKQISHIASTLLKKYYYQLKNVVIKQKIFFLKSILLTIFLLLLLFLTKWEIVNILFLIFFAGVLLFRIDGRVSILFALICLSVVPVLLILKKEPWAETLAIYTYYFLVIGVIMEIVEMTREQRSKSQIPDSRVQ